MIEAKQIPVLVEKLSTETHEIQLLILNTLYQCIRRSTKEALEVNAIPIIAKFVDPKHVYTLKVAACRCVMMIRSAARCRAANDRIASPSTENVSPAEKVWCRC